MKNEKWILAVVFVGVLTLFFFPSPEENFLWYVLTGFLFVGIVGWLVWSRRKRKD